jgi:hypothetical protein
VKAAQDEATPAALRRKTSEAQGFLLAEREVVLRRYLQEGHDAGSAHPCDSCAQATSSKYFFLKSTSFFRALNIRSCVEFAAKIDFNNKKVMIYLHSSTLVVNEHSEQARAPHTNGPRDVPRCGALSLLKKNAALQGG